MKLIPSGNLESANPVIPISWCIEPKDLAGLKEERAENIHLLIVIAYENGDEIRKLVPIDQVMEFLEFGRPGRHMVFAKIVWDSSLSFLRNDLLSRFNRRSYENEVLTDDRSRFLATHHPTAEMEVVVSKEHFPKEPPAWVKRAANFGFEYPAFDQCQLRRRLLMIPFKLFFAGIWAVITTIIRTSIAFFIGGLLTLRNVKYKALLHPWRNDIMDVIRGGEEPCGQNSWLLHDAPKTQRSHEGHWRGWQYLLLYPPVYLVLFFIVSAVKNHYHIGYLAAIFLIGKALGHLAWWMRKFLVFATIVGIVFYIISRIRVEERPAPESADVRYRREQEQREKKYDDLYSLVGCKTTPFIPAVPNLPPKRRTVYLRYHDLKARVCRPYAS